jgi:hypothetical protein
MQPLGDFAHRDSKKVKMWNTSETSLDGSAI